MTKKHFIALADWLKETHRVLLANLDEPVAERAFEIELDHVVRFCNSQSSTFKEARFRDYIAGKCGPNGGTIK